MQYFLTTKTYVRQTTSVCTVDTETTTAHKWLSSCGCQVILGEVTNAATVKLLLSWILGFSVFSFYQLRSWLSSIVTSDLLEQPRRVFPLHNV